jgi:hypothetical protein
MKAKCKCCDACLWGVCEDCDGCACARNDHRGCGDELCNA